MNIGIVIYIIGWIRYRRKIVNVHIIGHYNNSCRVLTSSSFDTTDTSCQTV